MAMMDKKIELAKVQGAKRPAESKPKPKDKKTIKEARNMGLTYVGGNQYANSQGQVTHLAENGYLVELNKD